MDPEREIQFKQSELKLQERDIAVKEGELKLKQAESRRAKLSNPVLVALIAALAAFLGAVFQYQQQRNALELERAKFTSGVRQVQVDHILTLLQNYSSVFRQGLDHLEDDKRKLSMDVLKELDIKRKSSFKRTLALQRRYRAVMDELADWLFKASGYLTTLQIMTGISTPNQDFIHDAEYPELQPPISQDQEQVRATLRRLQERLAMLDKLFLDYVGQHEQFMKAVQKSAIAPLVSSPVSPVERR